jgi:hypothetical protein
MTDKKLKVNNAAYTELSIQIAVLQASVDKLLQLAMKPEQEITIEPLRIKSLKDIMPEDIENARLLFNDIVPTDEEFLENFK